MYFLAVECGELVSSPAAHVKVTWAAGDKTSSESDKNKLSHHNYVVASCPHVMHDIEGWDSVHLIINVQYRNPSAA